jgi:hypothetical protein
MVDQESLEWAQRALVSIDKVEKEERENKGEILNTNSI